MVSRLVIVSNRVALPGPGKVTAGGLAVAVKAALRNRTGVWFGWSGKIGPPKAPQVIHRHKVDYAVIDLSEVDFQEYYNGFANRVLWPILHYRVDLQEFSRADQSGYMRVNRLFAEKLGDLLREDDIIWVHDYHLMPLAQELRARGPFQSHRIFPPYSLCAAGYSQDPAAPRDHVGALTYYDLVGFQTERDRDNFAHYLELSAASPGRDPSTFLIDGRQTRIGAFPVGVEAGAVRATRAQRRECGLCPRRQGQPRRDAASCWASTGSTIPREFSSGSMPSTTFSRSTRSGGRASTYLQITPKSRGDIQEYAADRERSDDADRQDQRALRRGGWTPMRYVNRSYSRTALAGRLSRRRRRAGDAAARRHESRRQGVRRRPGPGGPRRADPVAVRRRGGRTRRRGDRQSA